MTFGAGVVDGSVRLRELVNDAGDSERVLELGAEVLTPIVGTEDLELATRFELDTSPPNFERREDVALATEDVAPALPGMVVDEEDSVARTRQGGDVEGDHVRVNEADFRDGVVEGPVEGETVGFSHLA